MKYLLNLIAVFLILNCGGDSGFTPPDKQAADLTEEGWRKFSYGAYENSLLKFEEAIAKDANYVEAYTGAGWANARLTELDEAVNYFSQSISIDNSGVDAYAGLAFTYNAQKEYQSSIDAAQSALAKDSNWLFSHDETLNYSDLRLIMAEDYFALGEFAESLAQVQLLNASFTADVSTYQGRAALAEEIERLRGIV